MKTATEKVPLTDRQAETLRLLVTFWGTRGRSPTIRELTALLGIASPNGAVCNLRALADKGWIKWDRVANTAHKKPCGVMVPELVAAARAAADAYLKEMP